MKDELYPFQTKALTSLRQYMAVASGFYQQMHVPQVISFTAPTGAGKTIIMASLIESIFYGDDVFPDEPDAIFVWLSDSPELNIQSKNKIDLKADRVRLDQCVIISDDSFDQEYLEEGHIYFLNTQKLGKASNLVKNGDSRMYTIWETLSNTVREKADRLYVIIDEAHRGMQGKDASRATTIMQKFIKGKEDEIPPMPVVLGMSATVQRFNALVENTTSTIHKVAVTADEVRASGLLKDRIVITYPEENSANKDMAVLQAAADDWQHKWDHWTQYCREQHYPYVNPVMLVQVLNGTGITISETDLDDCLAKIEERLNRKYDKGEVVHCFGQNSSTLMINGLEVPYEEPSQIADNRAIKLVFFKESLSTGWDCPRAETMMSFRHAKDATYIAQLLGRMVRTPLQSHIQVDETLNDVHLYLPYFDESTVKNVVDELQNAEGGEIPAEVYGQGIGHDKYVTYGVNPQKPQTDPKPLPGQVRMHPEGTGMVTDIPEAPAPSPASGPEIPISTLYPFSEETHGASGANIKEDPTPTTAPPQPITIAPVQEDSEESGFDMIPRAEIVKAVNDSGLLTYDVRDVRISDYLSSLYKMTRMLGQSGLDSAAHTKVLDDIVKMIHDYAEDLRGKGEYEDYANRVRQFKLSMQVFDVFGETVDNFLVSDTYTTTDTDIDRQFRLAERKLGSEGVANRYGVSYYDDENPNTFKIDVILFAADTDCMAKLHNYAKDEFHRLNDANRIYVTQLEERFQKQYNSIVSNGDAVSKHNLRLPETVQWIREDGGKVYLDHLYADDSGKARIRLNNWEMGVLEEESKQPDFVCWLRNPSRGKWSLCIPYMMGTDTKAAYPDFLVFRKDDKMKTGYVIDVLEPHDPTRNDNIGKARGLAEYAKKNPGVGRIQLIRMGKDPAGNTRFKRLDMAHSAVRDDVLKAQTNDELDHIFDMHGEFL